MKTVFLIRRFYKTHTYGYFYVEGEVFKTIEPPWKNNQTNISCVPIGEYVVRYLPRSASGKYKKVYHVLNVPNRSAILIHKGNTVKHTRGCILPGMKKGVLGNLPAVFSSATALRRIRDILGTEDFTLKIVEARKC